MNPQEVLSMFFSVIPKMIKVKERKPPVGVYHLLLMGEVGVGTSCKCPHAKNVVVKFMIWKSVLRRHQGVRSSGCKHSPLNTFEKLKNEDCFILCSLRWVSSFPYMMYSMISRKGSEKKNNLLSVKIEYRGDILGHNWDFCSMLFTVISTNWFSSPLWFSWSWDFYTNS
jgi:hypothetical protein